MRCLPWLPQLQNSKTCWVTGCGEQKFPGENAVNGISSRRKKCVIKNLGQSFIVCLFLFHLKIGTKWPVDSEGGIYDLNASNNEYWGIFWYFILRKKKTNNKKSRDFTLYSNRHLRSVKLVCNSIKMPPASAAKPAVQEALKRWSSLETQENILFISLNWKLFWMKLINPLTMMVFTVLSGFIL